MQPAEMSAEINRDVGPMVDFVDNYPPQLIYFKEDKQVFLEEAEMSLTWHQKMLRFLLNRSGSDIIIHDIYTPNQMHTSRWWLPFLDPKSKFYNSVSEEERKKLWSEVKRMYQKIDAILGEAIHSINEDSYVVLSSDHGAIPLNMEVRLNNLFAKKGWLKFFVDKKTGETEIDWKNTKVVYLQMNNIYINPKGLNSAFRRVSGTEYESLRNQVLNVVQELKDENGVYPLEHAAKWENVDTEFDLPNDRVGDIVIANRAGYNWIEELTDDLKTFKAPLKGGYKQAVVATHEQGMWTPFVIMGPGVKKNYQISKPIQHIEQYPTIMKLLKQPIPDFVEGKPLDEIFQ